MGTVWRVLTRKKILDPISTEQTQLRRVLNTFDLTALGVGSTLGVGVYVLAGKVARDVAGPAVVISFLIATIASVFAGLCYAEFGARAPRAGSAYIYSYVCVGEFIAFIIGWNLILEYVIGSASVARGLSLYLDTLLNHTLENTFRELAPINASFMSEYFDFFSFGISLVLAIALAFGMKESSMVNNIFTVLNLLVVVFVVIAGSIKADGKNWDLPKPDNTTTNGGEGGFFPFGVEGVIKGAATCFYGFVGFDCIATTGEEVRNPKRAIPISIIVSLFVIFLAYFSTSTVITLMLPYYEQDPNAPIPHAFEIIGWEECKWVVAIGGIFGLCASLFGAMFPLPRIIYAMASDGVIFRFLGIVNQRFRTPVIGTLLAGLLTGLMSALFDLSQLVNMMSIGTLLAYTIVAASVLLLRYEAERDEMYDILRTPLDAQDTETYTENRDFGENGSSDGIENQTIRDTSSGYFKQIFNFERLNSPTNISENIVSFMVCFFCVLCILLGLCAMYLKKQIAEGETYALVLTSIVMALIVFVIMSIAAQPKSRKELTFKVPLVPLIPALSILVNIYLMLMLDVNTWIRFAVWMAIGIPTYYFSVKNHSDVRNMSLSSVSVMSNGKSNGYANQAYSDHEINFNNEETKKFKSKAPAPPTPEIIESTIAALDEILEKQDDGTLEDDNFSNRKNSLESMSVSNVLFEENVKADVHRADAPITPVLVVNDAPFVHSSAPSDILTNTNLKEELPQSSQNDDLEKPKPEIETTTEIIKDEIQPLENETSLTNNVETKNELVHQLAEDKSQEDPVEPETEKIVIPTPPPIPSSVEEVIIPAPPPIPPPRVEEITTTVPQPNDQETLKSTESDTPKAEYVIIPPPPPIVALDLTVSDKNHENDTPARPHFSPNDFRSVKLRKVSQRRSIKPAVNSHGKPTPESNPNLDDNIRFGTEHHKSFLEKLNVTLKENRPIIPTFNVNKNTVKDRPKNEDVIDDNIDLSDAKKKLVQFIEDNADYTPGIMKSYSSDSLDNLADVKPSANVEPENGKRVNENIDLDSVKEDHKKQMQNVFGSIRLRKVDSIANENDLNRDSLKGVENNLKSTSRNRDENQMHNTQNVFGSINQNEPTKFIKNGGDKPIGKAKNDDELRHRQNMQNVFGSIRLRKVDSFKE